MPAQHNDVHGCWCIGMEPAACIACMVTHATLCRCCCHCHAAVTMQCDEMPCHVIPCHATAPCRAMLRALHQVKLDSSVTAKHAPFPIILAAGMLDASESCH